MDELFKQLHHQQGGKVVTYGHELDITDDQARILVALNFVFEGRIVQAVALIENGQAAEYEYKQRRFYVVDNYLICLELERCACLQQWCRHLLAARLLAQRYSFLAARAPLTKRLSRPAEFVDLVCASQPPPSPPSP